MEKERRYVLIVLDSDVFDNIIKSGKITVELNGFPKDATFLGARYDIRTDCIVLCYEHESFDKVKLGSIIPIDQRVILRKDDC